MSLLSHLGLGGAHPGVALNLLMPLSSCRQFSTCASHRALPQDLIPSRKGVEKVLGELQEGQIHLQKIGLS